MLLASISTKGSRPNTTQNPNMLRVLSATSFSSRNKDVSEISKEKLIKQTIDSYFK